MKVRKERKYKPYEFSRKQIIKCYAETQILLI